MPKSKHSPEFRAKVSQEYLDGIGSIQFLTFTIEGPRQRVG